MPLAISPLTATIDVGGTVLLVTTPANGVKWSCSNCQAVYVKKSGLVTGLEPGVAVVTAKRGNLTASATITVVAVDPPDPPVSPIPPIAVLGVDTVTSVAAPVIFTTVGSLDPDGVLVSYSLSLGDGQTSSAGTPPPSFISHTYALPGTYTATLTVIDDGGRSATASRVVDVPDVVSPTPPTAQLAVTSAAEPGFPSTFSTAGTTGTIVSSGIQWGDNEQTVVAGPPAASPTHVYAQAGTYTATLVVQDANGLSATATISVVIQAGAPPPTPPVASLTYQSGADTGSPYVFSTAGTSTGLTNNAVDWGDGTVDTASGDVTATVSHAYAVPGNYVVQLTVTKGGLQGFATAVAAVQAPEPPPTPPTAALAAVSGSYATEPYTFSTLGTSLGLSSWLFTPGDGSATQGASGEVPAQIVRVYAVPGVYIATLTVTSPSGASTVTLTVTIIAKPTVNQPPIARLQQVSGTLVGESYQFSTAGTQDLDGQIVSWTLNFGDGASQNGSGAPPATVTHAYTSAGSKTAQLVVQDNQGATGTQSITVSVSPVPPPPSGGQNAYFDSLVARPDLYKSFSLRTSAQLQTFNNGGYASCNSCPLDVVYDAAFDAAKATIPSNLNSIRNQLRMPIGTADGNTYLFTWDVYYTESYLPSITQLINHKAYQLAAPDSTQVFEVRTRFDGGNLQSGASGPLPGFNRTTDISAVDARCYQPGPGTTKAQPMLPQSGTFILKPNRWIRFWVLIDQTAGTDFASLWVADSLTLAQIQNRGAILIPAGGIDRFWVELNTSTDAVAPGRGPMVSYVRNLAVLRNVADVAPLLVRPT